MGFHRYGNNNWSANRYCTDVYRLRKVPEEEGVLHNRIEFATGDKITCKI